MLIDTNQIVTITEANRNFSNVSKIADREGQAVIFKNSKPQYLLINIAENPTIELTDDERIDVIAARILKKHLPAFRELAK